MTIFSASVIYCHKFFIVRYMVGLRKKYGQKKLIRDPFILDPSAYASDFALVSSLPSLRHVQKRRALGQEWDPFGTFIT